MLLSPEKEYTNAADVAKEFKGDKTKVKGEYHGN